MSDMEIKVILEEADVKKDFISDCKENNLKCPFCQQKIMCMDAQDADEHSTWYCPRCIAERAWYAFGNETLWQELIRTRKALDVAKDTIRHTDWFFDGDYNVDAKTMHNEIKYAIKALEQKEQQ